MRPWQAGAPEARRAFYTVAVALSLCLVAAFDPLAEPALGQLKAGAAVVDITPTQLPVLVNGSMTSRTEESITTRVNARAIVLDDGQEQIGLVVVDSCMMSRSLLDEAKALAAQRTGLRVDRIMISATHTHTAPSAMGALGTAADAAYVPLLRQKLVEVLVAAEKNLEPAKVGWSSGEAAGFTALRRWVRRPDRMADDPFGNRTVRANMHAARNLEDVTGPSGPEDPELSMISFRSLDGDRPIAVLANFSMHYFGSQGISADYFGYFCDGLAQHMNSEIAAAAAPPAVAMMSHGCSGDIWRRDYMQKSEIAEGSIQEYTQGLLSIAREIYARTEYQTDADLEMAQSSLPMQYRLPDAQRLHWAEAIVHQMGNRLPQTKPEIYAREQIYLNQMRETEVIVQAIRIGDIAIATTPTETYALTGLKLKEQCPLTKTMVIELANGGDGYIPPPEQHHLGGYNTWAARSAGLETSAEPRMVAELLRLLEEIAHEPRRSAIQELGPAAKAVLSAKPTAYYRLGDMAGPLALDSSGHDRIALYEAGIVFYLEGPDAQAWSVAGQTNRCAHFAGGRLRSQLKLGERYTILLSYAVGMPLGARDPAGWLVSIDHANSSTDSGVHLGLSGGADRPGRLALQLGRKPQLLGKSMIPRWAWGRAALVRDGAQFRVYSPQLTQPEIETTWTQQLSTIEDLFIGGRSDNHLNWEGKIDEIAIYQRPLERRELKELWDNTTVAR